MMGRKKGLRCTVGLHKWREPVLWVGWGYRIPTPDEIATALKVRRCAKCPAERLGS